MATANKTCVIGKKTRMNGLSCGEKIMTIRSAVLIQYQRVTDRLTDGLRYVWLMAWQIDLSVCRLSVICRVCRL